MLHCWRRFLSELDALTQAGQGFWSQLFTGAKYAMLGTFVAIKVLEWSVPAFADCCLAIP